MRAGRGPRAADDRVPVYPAGTKLHVIRQGVGPQAADDRAGGDPAVPHRRMRQAWEIIDSTSS